MATTPMPVAEIKKKIKSKNIRDLGIWINLPNLPKNSTFDVEEVLVQIHTAQNKLVFSTDVKCSGCSKSMSLKATDSSTGYLLVLDKATTSAAKPHFVDRGKLVVVFKVKSEVAPDTIYLVNVKEGKPAE